MNRDTITLLHLQPRTHEELHRTLERFEEKFDSKRRRPGKPL